MSAVIPGLVARFNALPFRVIALSAVSAVIGLTLFAAYREGRQSADRAAAVGLARHNAEIAAKYMRDSRAAQDAEARERARAHELARQVARLKEQVAHVARGDASPGVDAAVHGVRQPGAAP